MGIDNNNMKNPNPRIQSVLDYLNPKNLKTLKECNDIYKNAKACYNKGEYLKAKRYYRDFLKKNTADFDTLIEIGICYYKLGNIEKSRHWLERAQELRRGSTMLKSYLFKVYVKKKDWNNVLDYFDSLQDRLEPAEVQKLRKEIPMTKRRKK